jgi:hypothetical protein
VFSCIAPTEECGVVMGFGLVKESFPPCILTDLVNRCTLVDKNVHGCIDTRVDILLTVQD